MTSVVNLRTHKYDVYIGRGSIFGNPIKLHSEKDREKVLNKYKEYFYKRLELDSKFKTEVHKLCGKKLGCFCKPKTCHGDVIAEYLNGALFNE